MISLDYLITLRGVIQQFERSLIQVFLDLKFIKVEARTFYTVEGFFIWPTNEVPDIFHSTNETPDIFQSVTITILATRISSFFLFLRWWTRSCWFPSWWRRARAFFLSVARAVRFGRRLIARGWGIITFLLFCGRWGGSCFLDRSLRGLMNRKKRVS